MPEFNWLVNALTHQLDSRLAYRSIYTTKCRTHYACDIQIECTHISTLSCFPAWRYPLHCLVHRLAKFSLFDHRCMTPTVCRLHQMKCSKLSTRVHLAYPNMTNRCRLGLRCTILLCYRNWPMPEYLRADAIRPFSHPAGGHWVRLHIRIRRLQPLPISTPICHDYMLPANGPTLTKTHFSLHFRGLPVLHCIQIHRIFCPKWLWSHRSWPMPGICHPTTMRHCESFANVRPIELFLWSIYRCSPVTKCEWFYLRRTCITVAIW